MSVENQQYAKRIASLQNVDATVRFLSIEPLLGPIPDLDLALTYDSELAWRKQQRRETEWLQSGTDETARRARYDELQRALSAFKARLLDPDSPPANQLPLEVWRRLNAVTSATPAIGLVLQALARL